MKSVTKKQDNLFKDQIDLLPIGICVVDQNLDIQQWNRMLHNWTNLHAQIAIGSNLLELFPHLKSPRFSNRLNSVFESGQPAIFSPSSTNPFLPNRLDEEGVEQVTLHKTAIIALGEENQFAQISLTDVTTQYEQIKKLRKEKEQHRISQIRNQAILETAADPIITVTGNGLIKSFNPAAEQLFGYSEIEVLEKNVKLLVPSPHRERHDGYLERFMSTRLNHVIGVCREARGQRKNGTIFPILLSVSEVILNEVCDAGINDNDILFTGIIRDLTTQKQLDNELTAAKDAAELASLSKSEFLANMSHEIRTPMTAILGFTDILLDNLKAPENIEAVQTVKKNGEYLIDLINDILDLSKIEAGKIEMEKIDCSPYEIVDDVVSLMRVRSSAKDLSLDVRFNGPIPEKIRSDPTRLRQILINLVGNAIKFTETGSVQIFTRLLNETGEEPRLQFDVIDSGIGIAKSGIEKLFLAFTQADNSTTRQFGGTGLGLTISKRLVEALGGEIFATSTIGKGSTFSVIIPTGPLNGVHHCQNELIPARQTIFVAESNTCDREITLHGCHILLAEDGVDNQRLIDFILRKAGAEVTIAENGQIAFEKATTAQNTNRPFDVILMDMQMPVMDGYESTRRLRDQGYSGPIIALTAHTMSGDREKCLEAGCDDFSTKPINREKLINTLAKWSINVKCFGG